MICFEHNYHKSRSFVPQDDYIWQLFLFPFFVFFYFRAFVIKKPYYLKYTIFFLAVSSLGSTSKTASNSAFAASDIPNIE